MSESVTLTPERLEEIREDDNRWVRRGSRRQRRELLAEVECLRAQVARVEALLDASANGKLYNDCYLSLTARLAVRTALLGV